MARKTIGARASGQERPQPVIARVQRARKSIGAASAAAAPAGQEDSAVASVQLGRGDGGVAQPGAGDGEQRGRRVQRARKTIAVRQNTDTTSASFGDNFIDTIEFALIAIILPCARKNNKCPVNPLKFYYCYSLAIRCDRAVSLVRWRRSA